MANMLSYYGLKFHPFTQELKQENVRFDSGDLKQSLAAARCLFEMGGIGMMCGNPGAGLSFSAYCAVKQLKKENVDVRHFSSSVTSPRDFYRELCQTLDVIPEAKGRQGRISAIRDKAKQAKQQGRPFFLILDNAQHLPDSVLSELPGLAYSHFATESLMAILLCGNKELRYAIQTAANASCGQMLNVRYVFKGLSEEEAKAYVLHRLEAAGAAQPLLTDEALAMLYSLSCSGNCRELNNLMRDALLIGYRMNLPVLDGKVLRASAEHQDL